MITTLTGRRMKKVYVRILSDSITCIVLLIGVFIMQSGIPQPYKRGFFLHDESIRYPLLPSQVSFELVILVGVTFNIFWILFIETLLKKFLPRSSRSIQMVEDVQHVRLLSMIGSWLMLFHLLVNFFMGAALTNVATDIPKFFFGRLRPYFYQICNATFTMNVHDMDPHSYVTDYTCMGNEKAVREARLSFPSGHSSMTLYFATYMITYSYFRLNKLKPVRNFLFTMSLLIYIVVITVVSSRVNDYRHHWSDVIAGMIIGCIIAIGTLTLFTDLPHIAPQMNCLTKVKTYTKDNLMEEGDSCDMDTFPRDQTKPSENVAAYDYRP
jgi:phosphatidate phosphatase